jgi:curved DNA-binding protein CbpA
MNANKGNILEPSLKILDLGLGASEIEAKVKYRQLARIYHPDKNNQAETGHTTEEASEFYLKERM